MVSLFLKIFRQTILLIVIFALFACSTSPLSIQLQPNLPESQSKTTLTNKSIWQIGSQDYRIAQYLVAVIEGDGVATLVNDSQSSRLTIEHALQQQWQNNGLTLSKQSDHKINIQLIELLATITQGPLSYSIDSNIILRVNLSTTSKGFSKTYKSHSTKERSFSADIKTTSEQLNIQLSKLLNEVVNDPQLNTKLQQL